MEEDSEEQEEIHLDNNGETKGSNKKLRVEEVQTNGLAVITKSTTMVSKMIQLCRSHMVRVIGGMTTRDSIVSVKMIVVVDKLIVVLQETETASNANNRVTSLVIVQINKMNTKIEEVTRDNAEMTTRTHSTEETTMMVRMVKLQEDGTGKVLVLDGIDEYQLVNN